MKGQEQIIEMRRGGMKPLMLWMGDYPARSIHSVELESKDIPEGADLRFVCGLVVQVEGQDKDRVQRWVKACDRAGAARVLWSVYSHRGEGDMARVEIIGMGDSSHVFKDEEGSP